MPLTTLSEAALNIYNARENYANAVEDAEHAAGKPFSSDDLWLAARQRRMKVAIVMALRSVGCDTLDEFAQMIAEAGVAAVAGDRNHAQLSGMVCDGIRTPRTQVAYSDGE